MTQHRHSYTIGYPTGSSVGVLFKTGSSYRKTCPAGHANTCQLSDDIAEENVAEGEQIQLYTGYAEGTAGDTHTHTVEVVQLVSLVSYDDFISLLSPSVCGSGHNECLWSYSHWSASYVAAHEVTTATMVTGEPIASGGGHYHKVTTLTFTDDTLYNATECPLGHENCLAVALFGSVSSGYFNNHNQYVNTSSSGHQVETRPATDVAPLDAVLNGKLLDDGGEACDCFFEWGETISYGETTETQEKVTGQEFSVQIEDLTEGTTYHFRAAATNTGGTVYGVDLEFTCATSVELAEGARVAGIIRRWSRNEPRNVTMEVALGGLKTGFGVPRTPPQPEPASPEGSYPCPLCSATFSSWAELRAHMIVAHGVSTWQ